MTKKSTPAVEKEKLVMQLFVSGMSLRSMEAIENIKRICAEYVQGAYDLEIVDIYKKPEAAAEHHIIFSPSLIKKLPHPRKLLIGTLSDTEKVIKILGITSKKIS
jgi:circadian clock protein KaiB